MGHVYFTYMNGSFFMVHVGKYTIVPWIPWTMLVGSRLFFLSKWYLFRWHVKTCLGTKEVGWRCASIEHRWHSIFCEYIETKQTNMTKKLKTKRSNIVMKLLWFSSFSTYLHIGSSWHSCLTSQAAWLWLWDCRWTQLQSIRLPVCFIRDSKKWDLCHHLWPYWLLGIYLRYAPQYWLVRRVHFWMVTKPVEKSLLPQTSRE